MDTTVNPSDELPKIVKYCEPLHTGIQSQLLSRCAIGYIFDGTKYIYEGDRRRVIASGDLFYLGMGRHYVENCPKEDRPFGQIMFYYTPDELQRILLYLNTAYGVDITDPHSCDDCQQSAYVSAPAGDAIRRFFKQIDTMMHDEAFCRDMTAESLKMTELVYLVVASSGNACIKNKLLTNMDASGENFEQIVYDRIFKDISIDELARLTNRSLTSFKKKFQVHFGMSPHQWFIRQRLMRARLLLISSSQPVARIGDTCLFPNTSHFIKLFRKEYNMTPATYRNRYLRSQRASSAADDASPEVLKEVTEAS